MYEALIAHLRECAKLDPSNNTYTEAADAIEKLTAYVALYKDGGETAMKVAQEYKAAYIAEHDARIAEYKPRWIPVEERLPENLTSVIVHRKDGGIFVWEYFNTSPTGDCWIDDSMNVYSFYDVTHWMPLPQPPEEE